MIKSSRLLRTIYIAPPIPFRHFDWTVYDEDESGSPSCVGFGATEIEAIIDYANELREYEQTQSEDVSGKESVDQSKQNG